jgi:4-amino-4-deoxy-L-arabinose transferase-like glycosyltransferase
LVIRVATVLGRPHRPPGGDPYAYYWGARLLATGHGFINPFDYNWHHQVVQSAAFAPMYTVLLAIPMVVGLKTYFVARLWTAIISSGAVVVVGLAGREIGGRRVALIAAFLTAVYPNIWMPDEIGAAESLVPLLVGAVLLFAYRFWKQPDFRRALWFGLSMGVLILARDELALLIVFMMVPLALLAKRPWRDRLSLLVVSGLATAFVLAPWVSYNMARFQNPTFVSNEAGVTLASADCNATFSGSLEGYWYMPCATDAPVKWSGDESAENAAYRAYVVSFLRHHQSRILPVTLAKIGRGFAFFHPMGQIDKDSSIETRPHNWALVGLYSYYVLLVLSVGGAILLRIRRVPIYPLLVIGLNVVIAMAIAFGNTRYRIPFEVPLVLMASVALDWIWSRVTGTSDAADGELSSSESLDQVGPTPGQPASVAT